jgi:hypothetical protein
MAKGRTVVHIGVKNTPNAPRQDIPQPKKRQSLIDAIAYSKGGAGQWQESDVDESGEAD